MNTIGIVSFFRSWMQPGYHFSCGAVLALSFIGCNSKIGIVSHDQLDSTLAAKSNLGGTKNSQLQDIESIDSKLQGRLESVLKANLADRLLSSETNAAWQIMHGVIAYGDALPLDVGGTRRSATDFLLNGGVVEGWELAPGDMLPMTGRQGLKARLEPGSYIGQGHVDQWLAILSQIDCPLTREVEARDQKFTVLDWARQAQFDVSSNPVKEYSWTIIALTRYFPDEQSWTAKDGKVWTLEPLAEFESQQDLAQSPCGGMHRLMGLAHAVDFRRKHRGQMTGGWKLAQDKVEDSIRRIKQFQNADGTFSTNHTTRPGTSTDLSATISSTGHTIEFLAFALTADQLSEPWLVRAVDRLCHLLELTRNADMDCGGLYHSLNGLKLYYNRRYEPLPL
jgi:hypothetical protein